MTAAAPVSPAGWTGPPAARSWWTAGRPRLLIADEPTGQLDSGTGRQIMRLLRTVVRSEGITALVATHDTALIDVADAVLELADGELVPAG